MTCLQCTTVWCCFTLINNSGQTKNIFGRNTETKTWPPGKAEILAETEILAENFFRPKQSISAETASFGRNVLFRPEQYMVLHQIFGQNRGLNMFFWPKETIPYFGHKRMFWQLILY